MTNTDTAPDTRLYRMGEFRNAARPELEPLVDRLLDEVATLARDHAPGDDSTAELIGNWLVGALTQDVIRLLHNRFDWTDR